MFIASAFGLAAGFSVGFLGKAFGVGFSRAMYAPGLVIVAAGFVSALAEGTGSGDWLMAKINGWRRFGAARIAALLGLVGGSAASPAAAFAVLTPLIRPISGVNGRARHTH